MRGVKNQQNVILEIVIQRLAQEVAIYLFLDPPRRDCQKTGQFF